MPSVRLPTWSPSSWRGALLATVALMSASLTVAAAQAQDQQAKR